MDDLTLDELTPPQLTPNELITLISATAMWKLIETKAEWWNESFIYDDAIQKHSGKVLYSAQELIPVLKALSRGEQRNNWGGRDNWRILQKYLRKGQEDRIRFNMNQLNDIMSQPGEFRKRHPGVPEVLLEPFDVYEGMEMLYLVRSIVARFFEPPI